MNLREIPASQRSNAEVLAALLELVPVREGDRFLLLPRREVIDLVEEMRQAGDRERAFELLAALEFDPEKVFRELYSQVASRSVRVQTSTLFTMLQEAARTGENRSDLMRRLLRPRVEAAFEELRARIPDEREDMVRYSLEGWTEAAPPAVEELEARDVQEGEVALPAIRFRLGPKELPEDLRKYSRYFLKNLFRLNNIYGDDRFHYPPELIERYWEFVSPNQGTFEAEIVPAAGSLTVRLFEVVRSFGLERTENPDYYGLVEFLAREARKRCIKCCRITLQGRLPEDDEILEEMMAIEADLPDGQGTHGVGCVRHDLSPEGLELFRMLLRKLSGIKAEVLFPVSERTVDGQEELAVLGFDIALHEGAGRFLLDRAEASERSMHNVVLSVGGKLLDLSRQIYRDPPAFPRPDIDALDEEVRRLIHQAEEDGLTEERAREIVAKITVLDYYESLAKYSYALSEQLVKLLEGRQTVTFTAPRVLLALLDRVLEERTADELVLEALGRTGP